MIKRTLFIVLCACASAAAAQGQRPDVEVRSRTLASAHDNLFHVSDDSAARTILAWRLNGRLTVNVDGSFLQALYLEADHTRYSTVGESVGGGGGLTLRKRRHAVWMRGVYWTGRPAFEVGDVVSTANILWTGGAYSYYGSDWMLQMGGEWSRVTRDSASGAVTYMLDGRIRYRGFRFRLEPEVGGGIGRQRVGSPGWDNERADLFARIRVLPTDRLRTSVRYRVRLRNYPDATEASSNAGRLDVGRQWTVAAKLKVTSYMEFDLLFDHLDTSSSREDRAYASRLMTLGVTLRYR